MRLLIGSRLSEPGHGWREAMSSDDKRIVIDLGAGDGRWAYESARRDPSSLFIAVDPDASSLSEYAFRAARKPSRGGIDNARFVVAGVEERPDELRALAALVRVNYPWGSLLRGLLRPEAPVLAGLAWLAAADARFELVMCYDAAHDFGAFPGERLPPLDLFYIDQILATAYAEAGLLLEERHLLTREEALAISSTWGRRLLHGRARDVYFLAGRFDGRKRTIG